MRVPRDLSGPELIRRLEWLGYAVAAHFGIGRDELLQRIFD
jgi:hypothetical protein